MRSSAPRKPGLSERTGSPLQKRKVGLLSGSAAWCETDHLRHPIYIEVGGLKLTVIKRDT